MQHTPRDDDSPNTLGKVVLSLYRAIETMSAGDRAQLRRLRPGELQPPPFWRLSTSVLAREFDGLGEDSSSKREAAWGLIASAMARSGMPFDGKRRLGQGLAEANVSELRLLRLLRSDVSQLPAQAHSLVQILASKGQPIHWIDFARLVLSTGRSDHERARRQIARDYFSNTSH